MYICKNRSPYQSFPIAFALQLRNFLGSSASFPPGQGARKDDACHFIPAAARTSRFSVALSLQRQASAVRQEVCFARN